METVLSILSGLALAALSLAGVIGLGFLAYLAHSFFEKSDEEKAADQSHSAIKAYHHRKWLGTANGMAWLRFKGRVSNIVDWSVYALFTWGVIMTIAKLIR